MADQTNTEYGTTVVPHLSTFVSQTPSHIAVRNMEVTVEPLRESGTTSKDNGPSSPTLDQVSLRQMAPAWFKNNQTQLRHQASQDSVAASLDTRENHLDTLRAAILELSGGDIAQLLMQDELLQVVTLVVEAITHVRTTRHTEEPQTGIGEHRISTVPSAGTTPIASPARTRETQIPLVLAKRHAPIEAPASSNEGYARRQSPERGRLPPLAFSKYSLGDDFITYIHNFEAIAQTCQASDLYMINQLKCQMIGDAKDLLDARLPAHMTEWTEVKTLVLSLFASQDLEHEAWDFLYTSKYNWGDNLDVHYSKFIKHAKRATRDQHDFMKKTARTHFVHSLPQDLMREAGLQTFASDDDMIRHLKKCMQFSTKPTLKARMVNNMVYDTQEGEEQDNTEELDAVVVALQSFGCQKKSEPARKEGDRSTFVKYPCSLCGKHGHNIISCELRPFLLDALPEFKKKLAVQKAHNSAAPQSAKPLN
jgi:hypothetical protein